MRYLLVKNGKEVHLYSPDTYGMETWGTNDQDSIIFKRKYWYISSWSAGNEWIDDREYDFKLNVVKSTAHVYEIINYVEEKYPKSLESVTRELLAILEDYRKFEEWVDRVK